MNRLCSECGREILPELVSLDGGNDVVDLAGEELPDDPAEWPDAPKASVEAEVRLSCMCSYYDVTLEGEESLHGLRVPDEWDHGDEVDEA